MGNLQGAQQERKEEISGQGTCQAELKQGCLRVYLLAVPLLPLIIAVAIFFVHKVHAQLADDALARRGYQGIDPAQ